MSRLVSIGLLLLSVPALAQDDADAKRVAKTYLDSLVGAGDEAGKDLLLGGVTMTAQLFSLENYSFKKKDASLKEQGDLAQAQELVRAIDTAGRGALTQLLGMEQVGDDLQVTEVDEADAAKLLGPTREKAVALQKKFPVLAYALRVGKEVYWHPKNPMRVALNRAGKSGTYSLEVHRWLIVSTEGPAKTARTWPLRVLRFKAGKYDTGWKVLPASDWNAE